MFTTAKVYQNSGDTLLAISDVPNASILLETSYVMHPCTIGVSQNYKDVCKIMRITLSTDLTHLRQPGVIGLWVHLSPQEALVTHMKNDV